MRSFKLPKTDDVEEALLHPGIETIKKQAAKVANVRLEHLLIACHESSDPNVMKRFHDYELAVALIDVLTPQPGDEEDESDQ